MSKKIVLDRQSVERWLAYCGFGRFRSVDGRTGVERQFPRLRSGIYVLAYKDGGYYVGLTIDVRRRFRQHVASKRPIAAIAFRPVSAQRQDEYESKTIAMLNCAGAPVENTAKMTESGAPAVGGGISQEDLGKWLRDHDWNDLGGVTPKAMRPNSDIEERYRNEFLPLPVAQDIIDFYAEYVRRCIIAPKRTVPYKWNVTCLPSTNYSMGKSYSLLNVGSQAVVFIDRKGPVVELWLKKSVFRRAHDRGIPRLKRLAPSVAEHPAYLIALGDDQLRLSVKLSEASALLKDGGVTRSIRALVVHNNGMNQSGSSMFSRFHCYGLAKDILDRL